MNVLYRPIVFCSMAMRDPLVESLGTTLYRACRRQSIWGLHGCKNPRMQADSSSLYAVYHPSSPMTHNQNGCQASESNVKVAFPRANQVTLMDSIHDGSTQKEMNAHRMVQVCSSI